MSDVRPELTEAEVATALGALEQPEDAMRQLRVLLSWGVSGRLAPAAFAPAVRALETWVKAFGEQTDLERVKVLEAQVAALEAQIRERV